MQHCHLCNQNNEDNGLLLTNNDFIHLACLIELDKKINSLKIEIAELDSKNEQITNKASKIGATVGGILGLVAGPFGAVLGLGVGAITGSYLGKDESINYLIKSKDDIIKAVELKKKDLFDYFPQYPPDWEARRTEVKKIKSNHCSICNFNPEPEYGYARGGRIYKKPKDKRSMHVHHIVPLSQGGSNKLSNLQLLCQKCHQGKHNHQISNFPKRKVSLGLLSLAIKEAKVLYVQYTDREKVTTLRKILPLAIEPYKKQKLLKAHCYLRNDIRSFNLSKLYILS